MLSLQGRLHGRKTTTDAGQQQEGGVGGLRRSNAVKHHGQQQQQQQQQQHASAGATFEERFESPKRGTGRTNAAPGLGSSAHGPMGVTAARARATTSAAAQQATPGSEWSYVPVHAQTRQHHGPGQREQLERQALDVAHYQRTQQWVVDQQKRMELTQPVTRKPLPQPPSQSQQRPGPRMQPLPQQQPQPTIPSRANRRPFFRNEAEVDACVRSTGSYEDGILNQGDWKTGKSVHPVQARRPVHVVTPSQCPVSRVASPVDEISDQREAARRALRRENLTR